MLALRARDREHIVEAHADIGDRDRPGRGGEALRGLQARMLVALDLGRAARMAGFAQLAPHLPRDPDQQQATDEDQPDDLHELGDDEREAMRSTSAARTPIRITFLRCAAGRPAASAPTTMALSPASTMSIIST